MSSAPAELLINALVKMTVPIVIETREKIWKTRDTMFWNEGVRIGGIFVWPLPIDIWGRAAVGQLRYISGQISKIEMQQFDRLKRWEWEFSLPKARWNSEGGELTVLGYAYLDFGGKNSIDIVERSAGDSRVRRSNWFMTLGSIKISEAKHSGLTRFQSPKL